MAFSWAHRITALYMFLFLALGWMIGALGPSVSELAELVGEHPAHLGSIFTSRGLGYVAGCALGGRALDRWRAHPLLVGSLALMAAGCLPLSAARSVPAYCALFALQGVGGGSLEVNINAVVVWAHGKDTDPHMQALHFAFGVGAMTAPLVVAHAGAVATFAMLGAAGLVAVPALCTLRSPERGAVLTSSDSGDAGDSGDSQAVRPVPRRLVVAVAMFLGWYVGIEVGYGGWVATYGELYMGMSRSSAAMLTAAFWGAITLGRLLAVPLSTRFAATRLLFVNLAGCSVGLALLVVGGMDGSEALLWAGTALFGLALASIFPLAILLPPAFGYQSGGSDSGTYSVGGSVGEMMVPLALGYVLKHSAAGFMWGAVVCVAAQCVLYVEMCRFSRGSSGSGGVPSGVPGTGGGEKEVAMV